MREWRAALRVPATNGLAGMHALQCGRPAASVSRAHCSACTHARTHAPTPDRVPLGRRYILPVVAFNAVLLAALIYFLLLRGGK